MNQKDHKAIAEIISEETVNPTDGYERGEEDMRKRLTKKLAVYFEREAKRITEDRKQRYRAEHKGKLPKVQYMNFNKGQFLKDCGVE